jgi:phosphatidylserine decarboxylase
METEQRFRLPVARDGWRFIVPLVGVALVLFLVGWRGSAAGVGLLAMMVLYFFRDPERKPPRIAGAIVSAADGRVTDIEEVEQAAFPGGRARRISVFLSLFSVHVNRAPVEGRIESVEYRPGRFHSALHEESARENERNRIAFRNGKFSVIVDQIAGVIARRVICSCQTGDTVAQGERIGLIRFGSRTDTFLPLEAEVRVKKGMTVRGGQTVLAILTPNENESMSSTVSIPSTPHSHVQGEGLTQTG